MAARVVLLLLLAAVAVHGAVLQVPFGDSVDPNDLLVSATLGAPAKDERKARGCR